MSFEMTAAQQATVTLWRPAGRAEIDLVAESGWRAWPPRLPEQPIFYPVLNEWYATRITRKWNVPASGAGYVTRFDVAKDFLADYTVHQVGGRDVLEYWIPAAELAEFNANIVGGIQETALYHDPVAEVEFTDAANALGWALPTAWHDYLRSDSWLRRGRVSGGGYLSLVTPREGLAELGAWEDAAATHPGMAIIGHDARHGRLVFDLRRNPAPVLRLPAGSRGWLDAVPVADDSASFVAHLEAGRLNPG